jgi:CPA2 family monovalent cation:H+ antiporter-2
VHDGISLVIDLSMILGMALVLGLTTERLGLSPIVGYLLAGIVVGPQTPGFVADPAMASSLAEVGVVLLMFGVGLHFRLRDLLNVRRIAIPGAISQVTVAAALGTLSGVIFQWSTMSGLMLGIAVSVASTVVLARVLTDNNVLDTPQGHIAVGWLIVEDIFTVLVLVVLPALPAPAAVAEPIPGTPLHPLVAVVWASIKVAVVGLLILGGGRRFIPWLLRKVARTRSRELFTLAILALALAIATASAVIFGVSMALGAFLAGMVVGRTEVSHQAAADALPMRDAFAVLFFVSIGMLVDPKVVLEHPGFLVVLLAIILVAKPLTAFLIVWNLRYSIQSALTVAIGLAQIGEFSFVLVGEAMRHRLMPAEGQSLLVTSALISITLNPVLFRSIEPLQAWLRRHPALWRALNRRAESAADVHNVEARVTLAKLSANGQSKPKAVVVGYGPVGRTASRILSEFDVLPVVIDLNLDTVRNLTSQGQVAVYGDATQRQILSSAAIQEAKYLLVTVPDVLVRTVTILTAKEMNPELRVFVRARYLGERAWLDEVGATEVCTEEGETAVGLAILLLRAMGADEARIQQEVRKIRHELDIRLTDDDG